MITIFCFMAFESLRLYQNQHFTPSILVYEDEVCPGKILSIFSDTQGSRSVRGSEKR